ncbi:MAG: EAL domain-containing protein [Methylophilus sp.]|nr:EAL domain-containing protein [Methylophilus sp.]
MSLINQIRIAFFLVIIAAAGGSLVFSTLDSKNYLEEELLKKNSDNANVLALSMSQMDKDPTTIELFISAQFDSGHYFRIGLFDPNGQKITERISAHNETIAPAWFTKLFPIKTAPGIANIQSGWTQFGSIQVESDVNFAYDKLWNAVKNMCIWVISMSLLTYFVCGLLLRKILRPLDDVITQAQAIGERRFITIDEPKTPEFKSVVREMNTLSNRIKTTLDLESERLDEYRFKNHYDDVTGLMNHDYFINSIESTLHHEDFSEGALILIRITNLGDIDKSLGYAQTNHLLKEISIAIQTQCKNNNALISGRVSGKDLAIFSSQVTDEFALANQLKDAISAIVMPAEMVINPQYLIVVTKARKMDAVVHLFKVLDFILELSSLNADAQIRIINANSIVASKTQYLSSWKTMLLDALNNKRIRLEHFPVMSMSGKLIHYESPVRLQLEKDGKWLPAGEFIDWAIQLEMINTLDMLVLETAVALLAKNGKPICLNVSESAMLNPQYLDTAATLIHQLVKQPKLLSFEIPEMAAFQHLNEFRHFCYRLKALGCNLGVEHFNLRISRLGELHDIGLDYIKFDASLIRGLYRNEANKTLLRGLSMVAHTIGISTIAEGVNTPEEISALKEIGMDGMTGPGVKMD